MNREAEPELPVRVACKDLFSVFQLSSLENKCLIPLVPYFAVNNRDHGFGTQTFIFARSNVPLHTARAASKSIETMFVGWLTVKMPDKKENFKAAIALDFAYGNLCRTCGAS